MIDRIHLYRELYLFEIERRDRLINAVSMKITVIIAVIVGLWYMISTMGKFDEPHEGILMILLVASSASVSVGVYYLVIQNYGYTYGYLNSSDIIEEYYNKIFNTYKAYDEEYNTNVLEDEFQKYMVCEYISLTAINAKNNDSRSAYLYRSNLAIIVGLIPLGLAFIISALTLIF